MVHIKSNTLIFYKVKLNEYINYLFTESNEFGWIRRVFKGSSPAYESVCDESGMPSNKITTFSTGM